MTRIRCCACTRRTSELDPFDEETIKLANPALDIFMNSKEVLAMAADAKRMPARQAEYENLVLNRRVETANPFVSTLAWKDCGGEVADLTECRSMVGWIYRA